MNIILYAAIYEKKKPARNQQFFICEYDINKQEVLLMNDETCTRIIHIKYSGVGYGLQK